MRRYEGYSMSLCTVCSFLDYLVCLDRTMCTMREQRGMSARQFPFCTLSRCRACRSRHEEYASVLVCPGKTDMGEVTSDVARRLTPTSAVPQTTRARARADTHVVLPTRLREFSRVSACVCQKPAINLLRGSMSSENRSTVTPDVQTGDKT